MISEEKPMEMTDHHLMEGINKIKETILEAIKEDILATKEVTQAISKETHTIREGIQTINKETHTIKVEEVIIDLDE